MSRWSTQYPPPRSWQVWPANCFVPDLNTSLDFVVKVELQFDSNLRRLAQETIITQQSEIDAMKSTIRDIPLFLLNLKRKSWCSM